MRRRAIVLHNADNVASALVDLSAGERVDVEIPGGSSVSIVLRHAIPLGHKFALQGIVRGQAVTKYGLPIGEATQDITPGVHVHTQNLA